MVISTWQLPHISWALRREASSRSSRWPYLKRRFCCSESDWCLAPEESLSRGFSSAIRSLIFWWRRWSTPNSHPRTSCTGRDDMVSRPRSGDRISSQAPSKTMTCPPLRRAPVSPAASSSVLSASVPSRTFWIFLRVRPILFCRLRQPRRTPSKDRTFLCSSEIPRWICFPGRFDPSKTCRFGHRSPYRTYRSFAFVRNTRRFCWSDATGNDFGFDRPIPPGSTRPPRNPCKSRRMASSSGTDDGRIWMEDRPRH